MKLKLLFLMLLFLHSNISFSQWSTDPAENTRVNNWGLNPKLTTDGAGGAIITFEDDYASGRDIVCQHVDSSGYKRWAENGVVICNAELDQYMWAGDIVSDGNGGGYIAWTDHRFSVAPETGYKDSASVYIQHINSAGEVMWQENGIRISNGKDWASGVKLIQDGTGEVVAAWINEHDDPPYAYHWPSVIMQRLTAAGELLWQQDSVKIISSESEPDICLSIINDDRGGFLLSCWEGIFRFNFDGELAWQVSDIPGRLTDFSLISDGDGGGIFYYSNHLNFNYKLYTQRVNLYGKLLWGEGGLFVTTKVRYPSLTSIARDCENGIYISWIDSSNSYHYNRIDSSGNILWDNNTSFFGYRYQILNNNLLSDENKNAIIVFHDSVNNNKKGYMQKIDKMGNILWGGDKGILFSFFALDHYTDMISDGKNGIIFVWYGRSYDHWGIFAQRVNKYGRLGSITSVKSHPNIINPSQYYLFQNFPNPFNQETIIRYSLFKRGDVKLLIFNIHGEEVIRLVNKTQREGNHKVIWNGKNNEGGDVSSGIYLCKLEVNSISKTKKLILTR